MPILQANWSLALAGGGLLFLLGAIFRWQWLCNPQGTRPMGFHAFVCRNYGEKGYRIVIGTSGVLIILCTVVLWVLM